MILLLECGCTNHCFIYDSRPPPSPSSFQHVLLLCKEAPLNIDQSIKQIISLDYCTITINCSHVRTKTYFKANVYSYNNVFIQLLRVLHGSLKMKIGLVYNYIQEVVSRILKWNSSMSKYQTFIYIGELPPSILNHSKFAQLLP